MRDNNRIRFFSRSMFFYLTIILISSCGSESDLHITHDQLQGFWRVENEADKYWVIGSYQLLSDTKADSRFEFKSDYKLNRNTLKVIGLSSGSGEYIVESFEGIRLSMKKRHQQVTLIKLSSEEKKDFLRNKREDLTADQYIGNDLHFWGKNPNKKEPGT